MKKPRGRKKWRGQRRAARQGRLWLAARKAYGQEWAEHLRPEPIPLVKSGNLITGSRPTRADDLVSDFECCLDTFMTFTDGGDKP